MSLNPANRSIKEKLMKNFGKYSTNKKCTNKKAKTGLQQKFTILKTKFFVDKDQLTTKHFCDQVEGSIIQSCDNIEQSVKHVCNQVAGSAKHPCDPDEHSTQLSIDQGELPMMLPYDQDKQSSSFIPNELNNYQVQKDKNPLNYEPSGRPLKRKLVKEDFTFSPKNKRQRRDVLNTSDETVTRSKEDKLICYPLSGATETQDKNDDQERLPYQPVAHRMEEDQAVAKGDKTVLMAVTMDEQAIANGCQAVAMDNQAVTLGDNKVVVQDEQAIAMENQPDAIDVHDVTMDNQCAVKGDQAVAMSHHDDAMNIQAIAIDTDSSKKSHRFICTSIESEKGKNFIKSF